MRADPRRRLQVALAAAVASLLLAACGSGPATPKAGPAAHHQGTTTTTTAPATTTTTATASSTLPPVSTSGPLTAGSPIPLPFAADRVTAAESPDGAVFAAPQDPASPAAAVAWVVDGNGPAAIAEHLPSGIAALAADGTNFYVATYATVYAYSRASGNQAGQWTMPPVNAANSSDNNLVAMAAGGGKVYVSLTQGNTVRVYRIDPATAAAPHLLVHGLGDAVGSDGSVYYESSDHRLTVLRPDGTSLVGPVLAHTPNGLGGGVQYVDVVAAHAVWVSKPAGQGLDAEFTTYDAGTLGVLGSYSGSVTSIVVDSAAGALVLVPAGGTPSCPQASPPIPASCVLRVDQHGVMSGAVGVGAAVTLTGPGPAVVVSDTSTGQFDLVRLS
jgi:hypothetical protein